MTDCRLDGLWKAYDNSFMVQVKIECLWDNSRGYLCFSGTAQYVKGDMYVRFRESGTMNLFSLMPRRVGKVLRINLCNKSVYDDDKLVIEGMVPKL